MLIFDFQSQVFGTSVVPFKNLPLLEVRLRDAAPEAFEMVLNYIYTDCIDPTKKSINIWMDLIDRKVHRWKLNWNPNFFKENVLLKSWKKRFSLKDLCTNFVYGYFMTFL